MAMNPDSAGAVETGRSSSSASGNKVIHVQHRGTREGDVAAAVVTGERLAFSPQVRAQTRPRGGWAGRLRESSAERSVVVDRPVQDVLPHIWRIKNVEYCERKADEVTVTPEQPWTGRYVIRGRIFGVLPWTDEFRYVLHEAGFHSEDTGHCSGGLRINGGFTAESHGAGCRIWHYERYLLPWPLAPLKPLITVYVRWTQRREMRDLALLIEKSERLEAAPD
jgi:hypothetical protein